MGQREVQGEGRSGHTNGHDLRGALCACVLGGLYLDPLLRPLSPDLAQNEV